MKPCLKVALTYLLFGVVWIFASDRVIGLFTKDAATVTTIQTFKGWFFVGVSALLIYVLSRRADRQRRAQESERRAVFLKTVEGAHHILLNYLNQMELVMLEAGSCASFDPEVLRMGREISDEASRELVNLGRLSDATSDAIESFVYRNLRNKIERGAPVP